MGPWGKCLVTVRVAFVKPTSCKLLRNTGVLRLEFSGSGHAWPVNMSKMSKKKSCFQITSVTQAQVAASCIADDTESFDDTDEPRTQDASSEMYDVSRADLCVCERTSSEETLNNNDEGASYKIIGTGQICTYNSGANFSGPATAPPNVPTTHPLTVINPGPAASVSANIAHTGSVTTNCSSRFRVIKLDHGTGEPFRRGRWVCTEFYERESDSNFHRAVDSIKTTLTIDSSIERDSGLGATINSVVSSTGLFLQAFENTTDSAFSLEHPSHFLTSVPLQQSYSLAPQLGSGASAFQSTRYPTTPPEKPQQAQGNIQPFAPQTLHSNRLNGVHQDAVQNSPPMPPATRTQQLSYSTIGVSTCQLDYHQQRFGSSTQSSSASAHPNWSQSSQVVSPELVSAGQRALGLDGEARLSKGIQLQMGNSALAPILTGRDQQQHTNQTQSSGSVGVSIASSLISHGGAHNTFALVTSTSLGGGHVQPQSAQMGILTSLPSSLGNHAEDHRHKADSPPQANAIVVPGRDGVKPFIAEGLGLPVPAVNSLFGIHISMNDDEDR